MRQHAASPSTAGGCSAEPRACSPEPRSAAPGRCPRCCRPGPCPCPCPCPCPAIPHTPPPGLRSPADVALCLCSILLQPPGEYRGAGRPPRGPCHRPPFLRAPALGDARTGREPARLHRQPAVRGALPAERLLERGVVFVNGGFYSSLTSPRAPRVWVRRGGGAVPASPPCRSIAGLRAGNVCLGVKSMRFPSIKVSLL